jgi:zinc protease
MNNVVALLVLLGGASAQAGVATNLSIPYEKYVLESNGLEVILSQDPSLPIVAVNIWYHAGPVNEAPKRTGFAHLFEHLMFQGSKHVGDDMHFAMLNAAGASMLNGTTDYDRTNYFETVPANQLELALWLESDRMGFLPDTLTQQKLDNQREVVMNERRQSVDNRPYGASDEALVQALFPPNHPYYGYVIGSMDDLAAASLDDVRAFYEQYYAPDNATLVIAGDFDPSKTKELVQKYFGTLPRRQAPAENKVATPGVQGEKKQVVEEPVELARVQMGWLSAPFYQPGDAEADVLAFVLGAGKSSRLYKRLVYELQIAQDVSAAQESLALASMFTVTVTGRPGVTTQQLLTETQKVLDEVRTNPPTDREVQRARNLLLTAMVSRLQDVGGFGGRADMLNRYNHYLGDPGGLNRDLARYDGITPAAVQSLASSLLDPAKRAVIVTEPKKG